MDQSTVGALGVPSAAVPTAAPVPGVSAGDIPGGTAARWGLDAAAAADMQGLVISPFADAPETEALFLALDEGCGGAWLHALLDAGFITSGQAKADGNLSGAVALTWSGLCRMNLAADTLATFPDPFLQGMTETDRQRRLGDDQPAMLFDGTLRWSGNVAAQRYRRKAIGNKPVETPLEVHALLLLYAPDRASVGARADAAMQAMAGTGVTLAFSLDMSIHSGAGDGEGDPPREHFGFADGFSQPLPQDIVSKRDPLHGIPVGEILMGYQNAHAEIAPAPLVSDTDTGLAPADTGQSSLGLNGTYMVVRQLHQNVAGFRKSMADAAAALNDPAIDADWMAERVIGRQRDGDLLIPGGSLPAVAGQPDNNFGFFARDREGLGCPVGSHIRRANPRDGLAPTKASCTSILKAVNNHRILRRARKYGAPLPEGAADDGAERGLLFMCLNADIERQFELVQQTWLLNPVFGFLMQQTDPLLGPAGDFTIPGDPLRRVAKVETYVQLVGGEYFFLPSLRALGYLGGLKATPAAPAAPGPAADEPPAPAAA